METTVTRWGFSEVTGTGEGLLPPAELPRGPHSAIGGRCRSGWPREGSALPFGIIKSDADAFHVRHTPPHHPVETPDDKIWITCLFTSPYISTELSSWSYALNEIRSWNKEYKETQEDSFLRATRLCHENRPVLLCQQTRCSVSILSPSSSLGTWVSISSPLSWNVSSPHFLCALALMLTLLFLLSVTKPHLSPHLAGGRTRDLPCLWLFPSKSNLPHLFSIIQPDWPDSNYIIPSLTSVHFHPIFFLCCHCCFSDTFDP